MAWQRIGEKDARAFEGVNIFGGSIFPRGVVLVRHLLCQCGAKLVSMSFAKARM